MDEWMSAWLDGLKNRETNTAEEQINPRSLEPNESCVTDHQLVNNLYGALDIKDEM